MKLKKIFLALIFLYAGHSNSQEVTPADEKIEARIARIYKKFNQSEITDVEWSKIAGDKNSETYTLQSGDTLWDISEKFFGTGFYWPKIWQLNDKITNPHMIVVGNTLKFSSGSDVAPPSLDVDSKVQQNLTKNGDDVIDTEDVAMPSEEKPEETVMSKITIPSGKKGTPPLAAIPESFPEWRLNIGNFDEDGFAQDGAVNRYTKVKNSDTFVPTIASTNEWTGVGKISEMEGNLSVASTYQKIVIKLDAPAANGEVFTVFANDNKIRDPRSRDVLGREIDLKGLIVVQEPVQGSTDLYSALVTRTVMPILLGDELVKGDVLIKALYNVEGAQSNISAKILDGERTSRKNFLVHDTVYLDRGQKDGLQVGSILDIFKNYSLRNSNSKVKFGTQVIGRLKVVDVGESISTAVLVSVADGILPGDETSGTSGGSNPPAELPDSTETPESFE